MRFLKTTDTWHSWYPLLGLDRAMEEAGMRPLRDPQSQMDRRLARVVSRLGLMRNLRRSEEGPVFVAMMGFAEGRTLPFSYWNELVPYAFDCWPSDYGRWASFFERQRVRLAFFSARQSAMYFRDRIPTMRSVWLPEAVDPAEYNVGPRLADRGVDVLELGRKHGGFHRKVVSGLTQSGRVHQYERVNGARVFPTRDALRDGLASSRISVCFPRSVTHPSETAGVETVTHRYFESMASGCIILGHAPRELIDVFGYNPVVEVQWGDEVKQISEILGDLRPFQDQVDANYRRLLEVGTWQSRVPIVLQRIEDAGLIAGLPSD